MIAFLSETALFSCFSFIIIVL